MITVLFILFFIALGAVPTYMLMLGRVEKNEHLAYKTKAVSQRMLANANQRIFELNQHINVLQKLINSIDARKDKEVKL